MTRARFSRSRISALVVRLSGRRDMKQNLRASMVTVALLALAITTIAAPAGAHDDGMDMDSGGSGGGADTGAMGQMGSHMKMSDHMTMTETRAAVPADTQRGEEIIKT